MVFLYGSIWVVYGLSGIISWDINGKSSINRGLQHYNLYVNSI
jgi:hypothetical protein